MSFPMVTAITGKVSQLSRDKPFPAAIVLQNIQKRNLQYTQLDTLQTFYPLWATIRFSILTLDNLN